MLMLMLFCWQAPGYFLRKTYVMCSFSVRLLSNLDLDVRLYELCFQIVFFQYFSVFKRNARSTYTV